MSFFHLNISFAIHMIINIESYFEWFFKILLFVVRINFRVIICQLIIFFKNKTLYISKICMLIISVSLKHILYEIFHIILQN